MNESLDCVADGLGKHITAPFVKVKVILIEKISGLIAPSLWSSN